VDPAVAQIVAKYFFLLSLDDRLSFSATVKVLSELKSKNWMDASHRSKWVEVLSKWRTRLAGIKPKSWSEESRERGFLSGLPLDLTHWASFQSAVDTSESEAVLLSKILHFTDEEIADGMGITVGTVRYRVGRGLRRLGGFVES